MVSVAIGSMTHASTAKCAASPSSTLGVLPPLVVNSTTCSTPLKSTPPLLLYPAPLKSTLPTPTPLRVDSAPWEDASTLYPLVYPLGSNPQSPALRCAGSSASLPYRCRDTWPLR